MSAESNLTVAKKARLIRIFGEAGARSILKHQEDLEGSFGSAAVVIRLVMEGKLSKERSVDPVFGLGQLYCLGNR